MARGLGVDTHQRAALDPLDEGVLHWLALVARLTIRIEPSNWQDHEHEGATLNMYLL